MGQYIKTGKPRGRTPHYPWEEWFATTTPFQLEQDKDFKCAVDTFKQSIRSKAMERGCRVSIQSLSDTVIEVTVIW